MYDGQLRCSANALQLIPVCLGLTCSVSLNQWSLFRRDPQTWEVWVVHIFKTTCHIILDPSSDFYTFILVIGKHPYAGGSLVTYRGKLGTVIGWTDPCFSQQFVHHETNTTSRLPCFRSCPMDFRLVPTKGEIRLGVSTASDRFMSFAAGDRSVRFRAKPAMCFFLSASKTRWLPCEAAVVGSTNGRKWRGWVYGTEHY